MASDPVQEKSNLLVVGRADWFIGARRIFYAWNKKEPGMAMVKILCSLMEKKRFKLVHK
jgi:hypothetical protein